MKRVNKVIVFLDDLDKAIQRYADTYLMPALDRAGKKPSHSRIFTYWNDPMSRAPIPPDDVAKSVWTWIRATFGGSQATTRIVFLTDLSPDCSQTPDPTYGMQVLSQVAKQMRLRAGMKGLLGSPNRLVVLFSVHLLTNMCPLYTQYWKLRPDDLLEIAKLEQYQSAAAAAAAARSAKPRVIRAQRGGPDNRWVADVIADWL